MDWKSIGLINEKMKIFLFHITPLSSSQIQYWAGLYNALNTLAPFLLLYFPCSILHILWPGSVSPNIFSQVPVTPPVITGKSFLSSFSQDYSYSMTDGTQRVYAHDPCLQPLLIREHFPNCISVSTNPVIGVGHPPSKRDIDILSPIPYAHLNCLQYENSCDTLPYCKAINFTETKSSHNKLRGFNLY